MKILGTPKKIKKAKVIDSFTEDEFPVIPLKNLVIFPTMTHPFMVGRKMSISAIEAAMKSSKKVFLLMQKNSEVEDPKTTDMCKVGTICEILQILKIPDGTIKVLVEGIKRARVKAIITKGGQYIAKVEIPEIKKESVKNVDIEGQVRNVTQLFEDYLKYNKKIPPESIVSIMSLEDPDQIIDIIMSQLPTKPQLKQKILEIFDTTKRLKDLSFLISNEIEIAKVEKNVHENVRKQMEKSQKEYYLQEQMKVIRKELGDKGDYLNEIDELKVTIEKARLPKEALEKCNKELNRLEKMPPLSAESSVVRTYIDWLVDLPWKQKTVDKVNVKEAKKILDEDHYGLKKVKERILEYIAVRKLVKKIKGQILCFIGPPGVGKTSLARSISRSLGRNFVRISLGGVRDEAEIRGHRRTYVGALPGRIIQGIKKAKTRNPVFLLDEIDKMSTDFRGDPSSALLEVLDPEQNNSFSDHYIELPFDLSDVFFITTANTIQSIPKPLMDRMELIFIGGYTEIEKVHIAEGFLIPKQTKEHGLTETNIIITRNGLFDVIRYYTREAGVRELERTIASLCRKVAKEIVENNRKAAIHVKSEAIKKYLGPHKFRYGEAEEKDEIGVSTGLAWTEAGGDIISIEVSVIPGSGKLILTGKLGEVFQESAQAALSYARSKAKSFNLPLDFHKKSDIHLHVPEGAVPKDGPSAGITIATALISALSKIPVRKDVAMTGEITLRGKILPVGGVKEKVLSANRADIKHVILPFENKKDFEDIPSQVQKRITFYFVQNTEQVLKIALSRNEHIKSDACEIITAKDREDKKRSKGSKTKKSRKKKQDSVDWNANDEIQPSL
ncbi:MAG: endopeptidase La [Spirochaetes bacterium]|nr:endopeptidase La [Spirochaetota bacterium]